MIDRNVGIATQIFAGNRLDRGTSELRKSPTFLADALRDADFCFAAGRRIALVPDGAGPASTARLAWSTRAGLKEHGLSIEGDTCVVRRPGDAEVSDGRQKVDSLPVYVLGTAAGDQGARWKCVVDVAALAAPAAATAGSAGVPRVLGMQLEDMRAAMPLLAAEELAVAGHAVALATWHLNHQFCNMCGSPTAPVEGGAKRQCTAVPRHRLYPRTDPVVIALVESRDGSAALLGRGRGMRGAMYTCLSGFVEQGESLEEAIVREVREEAGVQVGSVDVVGSQPWPIGRGGSYELMIGAIAKATSDDLSVNLEEMEDCRWMSRADLAQAFQASAQLQHKPGQDPFLGSTVVASDGLQFCIPPSLAIAHHLIKLWVTQDVPWFPAKL